MQELAKRTENSLQVQKGSNFAIALRDKGVPALYEELKVSSPVKLTLSKKAHDAARQMLAITKRRGEECRAAIVATQAIIDAAAASAESRDEAKGLIVYLEEQREWLLADYTRYNTELEQCGEVLYISELKRMDAEQVKKDVLLLLLDLVGWFDTAGKMGNAQLFGIADMILVEFTGLLLQDIALCFYRAKAGEYGQLYGAISAAVIVGWLKEYNKLKREVGESYELNRHLATKHNGTRSSEEKMEVSDAMRKLKAERVVDGLKK